MEAQELPIVEKSKPNEGLRTNLKKDRFTKLQGILLILGSLVISLVGGYFISDKFIWNSNSDPRIDQQISYYENKVSKEPNESDHRVNLGYFYHLKGKDNDAVKQLQIAIDLDQKNISAYFNLGLVFMDEKRYDDALLQSKKVVELNPKDYKGQLLQGMVYRRLKMYKDALASLGEANTLMPYNTDIIFEMGKVAEEQGKTKDAEELYKKALSYDPLYKAASEALTKLAAK